jgi:hypothetical protein
MGALRQHWLSLIVEIKLWRFMEIGLIMYTTTTVHMRHGGPKTTLA